MTSRPAIDLVAELVLDGTPVDRAVATMIRYGHPDGIAGLDALRPAITARRQLLAGVLEIAPVLAAVAPAVDDAVRAEARALFADPDDLARLEEAELRQLPESAAAAYHLLAGRPWHSAAAEAIFADAAASVRSSVHAVVIDRAVRRLGGLATTAVDTMITALDRFVALTDDGAFAAGRPMAAPDLETLEPLRTGLDPAAGLTDLADGLAWRRSAQHRLLEVLDESGRRRLQVAWSGLTSRRPAWIASMTGFHRRLAVLRAWTGTDRPDDRFAPYLFADLIDPVAEVADLDLLDRAVGQDYPGAGLDDVDPEQVGRLLGDAARSRLADLRTIARTLPAGDNTTALVRRRLPRAALLRALTPALRRRLGSLAEPVPEEAATVVLLTRPPAAQGSQGLPTRAAELAVRELVRRHRPEDAVVSLITDSGALPQQVARAVARTGAERAAVLVLCGEPSEGDADPASLREFRRRADQRGWAVGVIDGPGSTTGERVTATARRAVAFMIDFWVGDD